MTASGSHERITPSRIAEIIRRQWLVCLAVALVALLVGSLIVVTRPRTYQSTSSVALLPATVNPGILPNYPGLITSLIPTYVQLVSSPVLLDQVAAKLPFPITEAQLSNDVSGASLSNAAIINITANSPSPVQAHEIAVRVTGAFLGQLRGNDVVVPKVYQQPTKPDKPAAPSTGLTLLVVLILAALLGLAAGLIWDRLIGAPPTIGRLAYVGRSPPPSEASTEGHGEPGEGSKDGIFATVGRRLREASASMKAREAPEQAPEPPTSPYTQESATVRIVASRADTPRESSEPETSQEETDPGTGYLASERTGSPDDNGSSSGRPMS